MIELNAKYLFLVVVCSQTAVLHFLKVMLLGCFVVFFWYFLLFTFLLVCEVHVATITLNFLFFFFTVTPFHSVVHSKGNTYLVQWCAIWEAPLILAGICPKKLINNKDKMVCLSVGKQKSTVVERILFSSILVQLTPHVMTRVWTAVPHSGPSHHNHHHPGGAGSYPACLLSSIFRPFKVLKGESQKMPFFTNV